MKLQLRHSFEQIVSIENLLHAWRGFLRGKRSKADVNDFGRRLMDHIMELYHDLVAGTYKHGPYHAFNICDPKPRNIHKATVRDRLLHHAVCRVLCPFFDRTFIVDSYSCRLEKGVHKAMKKFKHFHRKVSQNNTRTCWILKCDIRKFFASIDHDILLKILRQYIPDQKTLWLIGEIVDSFSSIAPRVGLPLGNLTSQLLVNIYMNEFDQFVKHRLKARNYIRYADDFVVLSDDRRYLERILLDMTEFLKKRLRLDMHPDKVYIATVASGIDFLGWIHFPEHRILRSATRRRMVKRMGVHASAETKASYLGLMQYGNTWKLKRPIIEEAFYSGFPSSRE